MIKARRHLCLPGAQTKSKKNSLHSLQSNARWNSRMNSANLTLTGAPTMTSHKDASQTWPNLPKRPPGSPLWKSKLSSLFSRSRNSTPETKTVLSCRKMASTLKLKWLSDQAPINRQPFLRLTKVTGHPVRSESKVSEIRMLSPPKKVQDHPRVTIKTTSLRDQVPVSKKKWRLCLRLNSKVPSWMLKVCPIISSLRPDARLRKPWTLVTCRKIALLRARLRCTKRSCRIASD